VNPKILFALIGLAAIFFLICFAIWQEMAKRKLAFEKINPHEFRAFKNFQFTSWYVGIFEFKLLKAFSSDPDRMGKWRIQSQDNEPLGQVSYFNKYQSKIEAQSRSISSRYYLRDFTNVLNWIEWSEDQARVKVLRIEPFSKPQIFNIDHEFLIEGRKYRLRSIQVPEAIDYACELYQEGQVVGKIARVSARQFPLMVVNQEIDPLAICFVFDLFSRYAS
jgi:hypothetical protein